MDHEGLRFPNPVGPGGFVCPSLANRIPAQRHCLCTPYRSRSVFATAGKAVVEAKPIATPTIKYEIWPLLKDLMEWPSPPKSAYVIGAWLETGLMVLISYPVGIIRMESPGWLVSLVIGDYLAWFGEHFLGEIFFCC